MCPRLVSEGGGMSNGRRFPGYQPVPIRVRSPRALLPVPG